MSLSPSMISVLLAPLCSSLPSRSSYSDQAQARSFPLSSRPLLQVRVIHAGHRLVSSMCILLCAPCTCWRGTVRSKPVSVDDTDANEDSAGVGNGTSDGDDEIVRCDSLTGFLDYANPLAPASLLKCALLCMDLITLPSASSVATTAADGGGAATGDHSQDMKRASPSGSSVAAVDASFAQQLQRSLQPGTATGVTAQQAGSIRPCGMEIRTWSTLPTGTGLGTCIVFPG